MRVKSYNRELALEVMEGLSSSPKHLPTRFIYDDRGTRLFEEIMKQPEYYLTNCEKEIIENNLETFKEIIEDDPFNVVELGAGNGEKTKIMLRYLVDNGVDIEYFPIDISPKALDILEKTLHSEIPELKITTLEKDYFEGLSWLHEKNKKRNFVLFMGANIGNLNSRSLNEFLRKLRRNLNTGDLVMIGFDLVKDYRIIEKAYNDREKVTQEFTMNILLRINSELDADFNKEQFIHYNYYDPILQANKAFLVSKKEQVVQIGVLEKSFKFKAWEAIAIEHSFKFTEDQITELSEKYGFKLRSNLYDSKHYFCDTIWDVT